MYLRTLRSPDAPSSPHADSLLVPWFMQLYELKTYLVLLSVSQLAILKERTKMPKP